LAAGVFLGLSFAPVLRADAGGGAGDELVSLNNSRFEVVGYGYRPVAFVLDLGAFIADRCASAFELPPAYPQRILVSLLPPDVFGAGGSWRLRLEQGGFVSLDLHWDASLEMESLCRGLTAALLARQAIFLHGPGGTAALREWTVSATSTDAYLSLRPAMRSALLEALAAGQGTPPALKEVLGGPAASRGLSGTGRAGYWFAGALRASGWSAAEINALLRAGLAGRDAYPLFAARMKARDETFEPEIWWNESLARLRDAPTDGIEDLADSRRWIAEMARFEVETGNLRLLWGERHNPELRDRVEARLELLLLRMTRVNPAYHNAAQSLGELFETVLEAEAPHRFTRALARFLGDFEDARRLEEDVEKALAGEAP
jgi:hypothetical protein